MPAPGKPGAPPGWQLTAQSPSGVYSQRVRNMFSFPARFDEEDGGFVVTFRDIPEAITQGATLEDAQAAALDALVTAMDFYFEDGRPVPAPSKAQKGEQLIELPLSVATKVLLLNEMAGQQIRPADLAKRMHVRPQEVTRIMDLHHATKIDTMAAAFTAIGKQLELRVS